MTRFRHWIELTSAEIAALPANSLALLPVAAVEQHGPHLPVGTDALINRGILSRTLSLLDPGVPVVVLPEQTIGASQEHLDYAGTLSHPAGDLISTWTRVLECAARAGLTRLLILNSHGGQTGLLAAVCLDLRVRHGMLAAYATWFDAGYPDGLFSDDEIRYGFHGGAIETSLMMHLHPDLVRTAELADFPSNAIAIERATGQLSANPGFGRLGGLGWKSQDLNPDGVQGDASAASAEKGRQLLDHIAARLSVLIVDLTADDTHLVDKPHSRFIPASPKGA